MLDIKMEASNEEEALNLANDFMMDYYGLHFDEIEVEEIIDG